MRRKIRLKLTLSDETRLHTLGSVRISGWRFLLAVVCAVIVSVALGAVIVMISPLRMLLPGYLDRSERLGTEQAMLRIDSLADADSRTRLFLENLLTVTDTDRVPSDSLKASHGRMAAGSDSLMDATREERRFVEMMRDREKFNISVLAPLAADGMMFFPPAAECVQTAQSLELPAARFIIAQTSPVCAIADGTVISVSGNGADSNSIVIQHPNGFVSRLSGVRSVTVGEGSSVIGGQVIGMPGARQSSRDVVLEMWRDGDPLIPSQYVRGDSHIPAEPSTLSGEPMGR